MQLSNVENNNTQFKQTALLPDDTLSENYWQVTYDELLPGVSFKMKQLTAIQRLTISLNRSKPITEEQITNYLKCWQWTKGSTWVDLINESGTSRLPELDTNPSLGLDLITIFLEKVITPVFTESKLSQN